MNREKQCEILTHLPPYGPMYIPVTPDGDAYYSEGFVVRFFKKDGTDWVANFKPGWTDCSYVKEYTKLDRIIVIANGMGYIMNPESEKPLETFGAAIRNVIPLNEDELIISDDVQIEILNQNGIIWESPRISWDGIQDLKLEGHILSGKAFDPMYDADEWRDFRIDLKTKEIEGGSYQRYFSDDGRIKKRSWWKIWK